MSNRPGRKMSRQQQAMAKRDPSGKKSSRLTWWIGGGAVVVVALALVIALAVGGGDSGTDVRQTGFATTTGDPLPAFDGNPGPGDPAIGMAAPAILASDFDDARVEVTPGDGVAKVIGFFTHWCPHCQAELPVLSRWLRDNPLPAGVEVIAVSTSVDRGRPNHPPSRWFERDGWPAPIVRDSDTNVVGNAYGLTGFPYFVVVDGDGEVLARTSGRLSVEQWETLLALASSGVGDPSDLGSEEVSELDGDVAP